VGGWVWGFGGTEGGRRGRLGGWVAWDVGWVGLRFRWEGGSEGGREERERRGKGREGERERERERESVIRCSDF
jgi:hypothetical protein